MSLKYDWHPAKSISRRRFTGFGCLVYCCGCEEQGPGDTDVAITLNNRALVTIYGGSGFIGRHVVRAIAKTGARMRIAVRRPELAGHLQPLGGVGQINAVQANVRFADSLLAAADGADAVVNLVGILFPSGKQSFKSVQDEGARHVAEAARAAGARPSRMTKGTHNRRTARVPTRSRSMRAARRPESTRSNRSMRTPSFCGRPSCSGRRTISSTALRRSRASRRHCR